MVKNIILLIFLLTIYSSFAFGKKRSDLGPLPIKIEKPTYYLDKVQKEVGGRVVSFSEEIDSFFGGKPRGKVLNSSEVTVSWLVNKTEGEDITHTPEIGLRLVLPRTEKKLQVVVENKTKEINNILQEDKVESGPVSSGKEDKGVLTASMRYIIQQKEDWNIYSEGGIKIKVPLQPFAGITGGRVFTLDKKWTLDTKAQLVWYLDDGLSEVTTANIDYLISNKLLFRIRNSLTWIDKTGLITTIHGPILFQKIDAKKAINYYLGAHGKKEPRLHIYSYDFGSTYRQLFYKTWAFYEVGVKGSYPKEKSWNFVPSISVKLELNFGGD
tara:strand:+ start:712 stop:1689 length:978 start_codon:yes stop_codon:yes gene_type:complete